MNVLTAIMLSQQTSLLLLTLVVICIGYRLDKKKKI